MDLEGLELTELLLIEPFSTWNLTFAALSLMLYLGQTEEATSFPFQADDQQQNQRMSGLEQS